MRTNDRILYLEEVEGIVSRAVSRLLMDRIAASIIINVEFLATNKPIIDITEKLAHAEVTSANHQALATRDIVSIPPIQKNKRQCLQTELRAAHEPFKELPVVMRDPEPQHLPLRLPVELILDITEIAARSSRQSASTLARVSRSIRSAILRVIYSTAVIQVVGTQSTDRSSSLDAGWRGRIRSCICETSVTEASQGFGNIVHSHDRCLWATPWDNDSKCDLYRLCGSHSLVHSLYFDNSRSSAFEEDLSYL